MYIIIWSDISFPFVRLQLAYQKKRPPPHLSPQPPFSNRPKLLRAISEKKNIT